MKRDSKIKEIFNANLRLNKKDLAEALGVDPRTVQRYIRKLKEEGMKIEVISGRNGGYIYKV